MPPTVSAEPPRRSCPQHTGLNGRTGYPHPQQSQGQTTMQMHPIEFPAERRQDPMRRAEARVFDEIQRCNLPGFAYYEWQRDHNSPQLDFALWLPDIGRFGLEVKGGPYSLKKGKWFLETGGGPQEKKCLLGKTWNATMSLHDELVDLLEHKAFCIAVLVFPDMEPDQAIVAKAKRTNVHVLWGTDDLMERLREIADARRVYNPPGVEDIRKEVAAVTDEQGLYEPPADRLSPRDDTPASPVAVPRSPMEVAAGNITIQHVDVLNVYTVSGWTPGTAGPGGEADPAEE